MCGFFSYLLENGQAPTDEEIQSFRRLNDMIVHRGPDDEGYYFDDYVRFGFRRLSIIDVEHGKQPLSFENERYWIVFNGEIYNYKELRKELQEQGMNFSTECDTEVIVALYSRVKEKAVERLRGMFAFLIWDKEERILFGARDPFGIKPLYYAVHDGKIYFASEKKVIMQCLDDPGVAADALQHYMTYQYVPEPSTLTAGISKLSPGTYFRKRPGSPMEFVRYWKVSFDPINQKTEKWVKEIRQVLFDSVQFHMRSDVPVGSFLSGGIDSSLIVAIAREFHPSLKTFSVGFQREGYSEIDVARETAEKLGVDNISYVITPEEYMAEFPKIMWHMDDPLADPACVPLYFVAREARKHVTVALSGEGSDELFGGYNIYREPHSLRMFSKLPSPILAILRVLARIIPEGIKGKSFLERGTTPLEKRYIGNAKMFDEREKRDLLVRYNDRIHYLDITDPLYAEARQYDPVTKMQYIDIHTWLAGDILLKADKMTMAHSLEVRVPFLDKEVFRVASKIPPELKTAEGTTKYILRKAAEGIVPDHVLNRKKLGFPVPTRYWLKDEMYDWARELVKESGADAYLNKSYVLQLLEDHRKGKADYSRKIWTVLAFIVWHQVYMEKKYDFAKGRQPETVMG